MRFTFSLPAAFALLSVAACNVTAPVPNPVERTPSWYQETAVSTVQQSLLDPQSMRLHNVSEPFAIEAALQGQTGVCVTINATNSYGGYAGVKTFLVSFMGGNLRQWGGLDPVSDITPSASRVCPR